MRRLAAAGRLDEAFAVQAQAERHWPNHPAVLAHRVWLLPYYRDPQAALPVLERSESGAAPLPALLPRLVKWRADPTALDLAQLDAEAATAFGENKSSAWFIVWAMHSMGQNERAFTWLARAPKQEAAFQWSVLFTPAAKELRRDPRFFQAMADLGLVELWRKRGQWPDFCSEPGLRYSCAHEAQRLAGSKARKV